jgi:hypothetical protein
MARWLQVLLWPIIMAVALWIVARDLWRGRDGDGEQR